ncbi:MAG: cytochrome c family protein [Planctomycetes bacterium]|nr:cytochrome c family protein [Planctomycetota bacterium]
MTVGTKGKHAGALGIFPNGGPKPQIRFELVPLDNRFAESKEIRQLLDEVFLQRLKELKLVERTPKRPFDPSRPDRIFVGSEKCARCHPNVYEQWTQTDHANALQTLVLGHARNKPQHQAGGKEFNPECIVCHTTGFNYTSGYDGTPKTAHLGGNGCENCHRPGSEHVAIYSNPKSKPEELTRARWMMHVELSEQICKRCHDGENDPTFVFEKRWFESDPPVEHGDAAEKDRKLWPSIREKLAN